MTEKRILIAHIASAHGVRGELVLHTYAGDPLDLQGYGELSDEAGARSFRVLSIRVAGKGVVARLEGIDDRNAAEAMRGTALYVARARLPAPADDEHYHADLIGLAAVGPDGRLLGRVLDVANYGAGDLLEIELAEGGGTVLVPFADGFVGEVDVTGGRVVIELPEETSDSN